MASEDRPDRYDALIKQRQRDTDQAARALALREREIVKLREQREDFEEQLRGTNAAPGPGDAVDVQMMDLQHGRGAVLRQAIARSEMRIQQLERDASKRRQELVHARQRLKAAETLRDRLHERIASERARRERVELDEIAVLRHDTDDR